MPANLDKPYRWKKDIARSVDAFNRWFLENAPLAFQEQRSRVTTDVCQAMAWTKCFTRVGREILKTHPDVLPVLRMATCPPLARDRVVGLAGVGRNLVSRMEKGSIPPRMSENRLDRALSRIGCVIGRLLDTDICPWIAEDREATREEMDRASVVIADRLCGAIANPLIRNAQENRQLEAIQAWIADRGYHSTRLDGSGDPRSMPPGTFVVRKNIIGWLDNSGDRKVNIPVDLVIMPRTVAGDCAPLFVEAKSAGDYANVNKRRKEEATKARQLRHRYGLSVQFVLFLGGYFDSGYLGYEAAEGIDWVWEHRIGDFAELGL